MKWIRMTFWFLITIGLFLTGIWILFFHQNFYGIFISFFGAAIWATLSLRIIGPDEMAVFIWLGNPIDFKDSGLRLALWPFVELKRYPKKTYNFLYKDREVISKADKKYGDQVLKVDAAVYLNFPRESRLNKEIMDEEGLKEIGEEKKDLAESTHPLIKILRAGIPVDDKGLEDWVGDALMAALRHAIGNKTWKEAIEDIIGIKQEIEKVLKEPTGAMVQAGFSAKGIKMVVSRISPPPKLQEAFPQYDVQRIQSEAAIFKGERTAKEAIGAVVDIFCELTGTKKDVVKKEFRKNPKGFVEKYKEVWEKSWDIVWRRMSIDGNSYLDIRSQNSLQDIVALLRKMPLKAGTEREKVLSETKAGRSSGDMLKTNQETRQLIEETKREKGL